MTDKKHPATLIEEHMAHRKSWGRTFVNKKDGASYQLLRTAHDTETQELMAVFCLNAMSMLQFVRPMVDFLAKHDEIKG